MKMKDDFDLTTNCGKLPEKLKTSKDIILRNEKRNEIPILGHCYIDGDELKAEAIKRVKSYRKQLQVSPKLNYKNWILIGRIRECKEANDLTEEDLK